VQAEACATPEAEACATPALSSQARTTGEEDYRQAEACRYPGRGQETRSCPTTVATQ